MTQETMTKEQIIIDMNKKLYGVDFSAGMAKAFAMMKDGYDLKLSAEQERAGKLVEALKDAFDEFEDLNLHRQAARIHETLNEYDTATKES